MQSGTRGPDRLDRLLREEPDLLRRQAGILYQPALPVCPDGNNRWKVFREQPPEKESHLEFRFASHHGGFEPIRGAISGLDLQKRCSGEALNWPISVPSSDPSSEMAEQIQFDNSCAQPMRRNGPYCGWFWSMMPCRTLRTAPRHRHRIQYRICHPSIPIRRPGRIQRPISGQPVRQLQRARPRCEMPGSDPCRAVFESVANRPQPRGRRQRFGSLELTILPFLNEGDSYRTQRESLGGFLLLAPFEQGSLHSRSGPRRPSGIRQSWYSNRRTRGIVLAKGSNAQCIRSLDPALKDANSPSTTSVSSPQQRDQREVLDKFVGTIPPTCPELSAAPYSQ